MLFTLVKVKVAWKRFWNIIEEIVVVIKLNEDRRVFKNDGGVEIKELAIDEAKGFVYIQLLPWLIVYYAASFSLSASLYCSYEYSTAFIFWLDSWV